MERGSNYEILVHVCMALLSSFSCLFLYNRYFSWSGEVPYVLSLSFLSNATLQSVVQKISLQQRLFFNNRLKCIFCLLIAHNN